MKLYFFRHAIAEDDPTGMHDNKRELTAKGIERTKLTAPLLVKLGVQPDRLYSSPLTRAVQTAELLAPALRLPVLVCDDLGLGFDTAAVERLIAEGDDADLMFVGHEPGISAVIAEITGGSIQMKKGGLARVDVDMRNPLLGTLVWLLAPKVFTALDEE